MRHLARFKCSILEHPGAYPNCEAIRVFECVDGSSLPSSCHGVVFLGVEVQAPPPQVALDHELSRGIDDVDGIQSESRVAVMGVWRLHPKA